MYKWLTLIVALLALGLSTAVSEAGTIRLQGKFTRAQIAKACASVEGGGGAPFGTQTNRGSFGCLVTTGPNTGNQVNCTANGTCTGTCPPVVAAGWGVPELCPGFYEAALQAPAKNK